MTNSEKQWANAMDVMESVYNNLGYEDNYVKLLQDYEGFVIGQKKAS